MKRTGRIGEGGIRHPDQLRCLEVQARQEILDAVQVLQPCSAREVAEHLGRRQTALYHHVQRLVAAGLIVECGARATGRRPETLYQVPHDMCIRHDADDPESVESVARIVDGIARTAAKDYRSAITRDDATLAGPERNVWAGRVKLWLSAEDLAEVNLMVERLTQFMGQRRGESRSLHAITWVLARCAD